MSAPSRFHPNPSLTCLCFDAGTTQASPGNNSVIKKPNLSQFTMNIYKILYRYNTLCSIYEREIFTESSSQCLAFRVPPACKSSQPGFPPEYINHWRSIHQKYWGESIEAELKNQIVLKESLQKLTLHYVLRFDNSANSSYNCCSPCAGCLARLQSEQI